ncbi:MAG: hypothetical protein ABIF85_00465 [Nanoarchaeota archaeon]|nr:hypothetical protein [Nanoarchaeota archaeon]MBU4300655.1 hypothetical protein [Nanoarchaeota archaeon]MBU4452483.1 hypothetical protein [Nanoarchaeota archaeon]MCG2723440.1 hypothetical protein [archaeon]
MADRRIIYGTMILIFVVVAGVGLYLFSKQLNNQFDQISVSASSSSSLVNGTFIACGCGCCIGVEPEEKCLYHSKKDSLQKIIEKDKQEAKTMECPMLGCNYPIKYTYCD